MTYRIDDLEVPAESPFRHDALDRKPLVEFLGKRSPLKMEWVPMKGRC